MLIVMERWMRAVSRVALVIAGLGLVAMTGAVFWQVFGRYVLNDTPTWVEPGALFLMSWFILLGAAVGVRERDHLGFELGLLLAPPRLRFGLLVLTEVLVAGLGGAMFWYGTALAMGTWGARMPMLGISQGWDYVPIAVGGVLICLFSLEKLILLFAGRDVMEANLAPAGSID